MAAYQESAAVAAARKALEEYNAQKPAAYSSQYQGQIDSLYDKINNREAFHYDPNQDATYRIMKDSYIRQGKQAMKDTQGQAAGLTGGYGSTYGQNAGQQAYQEYLSKLNDAIPELEEKAYNRYQNEGTALENQLSLAQQMESTAYGRYQDQLSAFMQERSYLNDQYNNERNSDYSIWQDAEDRAYQAEQDRIEAERYAQELAYQKERDAISDEQWQKEFDENVRQYNASLAARSSSGGNTTEDEGEETVSGHIADIIPEHKDEIIAAAKKSETMLNKKLDEIQQKYKLTNAEWLQLKADYSGYIPEKQNQSNQKAYNNKYNSYTGKYQGGASNATGYYTTNNMF